MKLLPPKTILNDIVKISLPVVGGLSTQMILSLVDTAMVGRLDNSTITLAALGLGFLAAWVITSLFSSLSTGTHVLIARRQGQGNPIEVGHVLNNSLILSLVLGIFTAIIGYFYSWEIIDFFSNDKAVVIEGEGYLIFRFLGLPFFLMIVSYRGFFYGIAQTKVFLKSSIAMMVVHIISNFLFIYGLFGFPKLGLTGAGVASFISMIVGWLFFFIVTFSNQYRNKYGYYEKLGYSSKILKQILKISLPVSLQNVMILLGFLVFMALTGIIGTAEQAASQVIVSALFLTFIPTFGLGITAQTLVGQSIGEKNLTRALLYGLETARVGTYIALLIGIIFILFPTSILSLITTNDEVIKIAVPLLQIAGVSQIFYGGGIIIASSLQAAGATVYVMIVEVITHWVIFLPLVYVFGIVLSGGVLGAWLALPVYVLLFSTFNYLNFRSKSWIHIKI